jgi:DnaJ-class molecular chaperone
MEFLQWVIKGGIFVLIKKFLPKILPYINQMIREPLFGVILAILIALAIIGTIAEHREKKSKLRHTPKETEGYSDKKRICYYCKGYGELVTKDKGQKKICPHCSGTGWTVEV